MIDVNYLNYQPKEFTKETNILKYLFNVLNEIKQELLYIKNNSECEYKNFDTPTKNLINSLKNLNNEMNNILNEDYSNSLKSFQYIIGIFMKSKKIFDGSPNQLEKLESPSLTNAINNTNEYKDLSSKNLLPSLNNERFIHFEKDSETILIQNNNNNSLNADNVLNNSININNNFSNVNDDTIQQVRKNSNTSSPGKPTGNLSIIINQPENTIVVNNHTSINSISNPSSLHSNSIISCNSASPANSDELSNFNLITKIFNDINNQITESLKGSQESISSSIKELSNQRIKFKTLNQKAEKTMKEIENSILQRKKLDSDEKGSYYLSVKEKSEDKILNLLNEFDELKAQISITFEDAKKAETNLNEIIKTNFLFNLMITIQGIRKLKMSFDEMIDNKIKYLKKTETLLLDAIDNINRMEIVKNNAFDVKNLFDLKGIVFTKLDSINFDEIFPKNSILPINLVNIEAILSNGQAVNLMISTRKKTISFIQKISGEILKNMDNLVYCSSKSIKNLITPKSNLINSCAFIIQIREFLKSSFELIIKKYEELNKFMTNNLMYALDSQIKDITADENMFSQFSGKFQKELNNYKSNFSKLQQNKEKAAQNLEKIKELVMKSTDDQSNLQKFEKQLMTAMSEEDSAKETLVDLNKKFRKFCEENFEYFKKNYETYKDKENLKNRDLKEQVFSIIKQKNKLINHIFDFLNFKTTIQADSVTCIHSIEKIYSNFFKELGIAAFEENELFELVKFLYYKYEQEDLSLKKIISSEETIPAINLTINSLIKKLNFIIKDESIFLRKESEYLSCNTINNTNSEVASQLNNNIFKEEDLKAYYDKLSILKSNSKKISVRHLFEPNRKRYDDIFYYDADEIVDLNSFSCALSDKILLQGKLFITNKKLVFYSWFNNTSLFGSTLIEIPKNDILDVKKEYNMIFDNSIEIHTKNISFFFTSFVYRDKCYSLIREIIFGEIEEQRKSILSTSNILGVPSNKLDGIELTTFTNLNKEISLIKDLNIIKTEIGNENLNAYFESPNKIENDDNNLNNLDEHCKINENLQTSENNENILTKKDEIANKIKESHKIQTLTQRELSEESKKMNIDSNQKTMKENFININFEIEANKNISNISDNLHNSAEEFTKNLIESDLKSKIDNLHERNYEIYLSKNKREYNTIPIKDKDLGDLPLPYIYNSLFNIDMNCEEMKMNKSFLRSLMEIRKDYDISLAKPPEENWEDQIPTFYKEKIYDNNKDKQESLILDEIFTDIGKFKKVFLEDFSDSDFDFNSADRNRKNTQSYKYNLVHPILKKRFMGPSKLNIEDIYKVFFISPKCFIVDNYSYMSGFMMMDCFFSVMQFKFDTDYEFASSQNGTLNYFTNKTKLTISFCIEFIKPTMFKQKIIDNAVEDTNDSVKTLLYPTMEKVAIGQRNRFANEKKVYLSRIETVDLPKQKEKSVNIIEKLQENVNLEKEIEEKLKKDEANIKRVEDIQRIKEIEEKIKKADINIGNDGVIKTIEEFKVNAEARILPKEELDNNKNKADEITNKEACENVNSILKTFIKENIYLVFFVISIVLLIFCYLEILNPNLIIVFINIIGFAVIFEKIDSIEKKIGVNKQ